MRAVALLLLAVACTSYAGAALAAGAIFVPVDNVTIVTFKRPVATAYLGNSTIAELTIIDSRHVFVLGKTFGTTNLIALDADKSVISNEPVTVSDRRGGAVTVIRGADTYNYSCTQARCETHPQPGDPKTYFETTQSEASEHDDAGVKSAVAGGMQQQH